MDYRTHTDGALQQRRDAINAELSNLAGMPNAGPLENRLRYERLQIDEEMRRRWEAYCKSKSDPYDEGWGDDNYEDGIG